MQNFPLARHFRYASLLVTMAVVFSGPTMRAAAADAATRASLFQAEARKIFEKDHWIIIRKEQRTFTAVHEAAPGGETAANATSEASAPLLVHVSITFTPKTTGSTDCAVNIEAYRLVPPTKTEKSRLTGPFKADYPENANYIRKVLEAAEDRIGERHPEYRSQ